LGLDVVFLGLSSEHTLGFVTVTLAFAVLFEGVLDGYLLVHQVLSIHVGDGVVGSFEVGEGYKAEALGETSVIASDLEDMRQLMVLDGG
jgi:hypothetical protein